MSFRARFDVIAIGEPLVELTATNSLRAGTDLRLSFSGDALNAAAAAAATGARVALLARVADDPLGDALVRHLASLGVDTSLVRRAPQPSGVYFNLPSAEGRREFVYLRSQSAGSMLDPRDVDAVASRLAAAGSLIIGGIAQAISSSSEQAVERAAQLVSRAGGAIVYDPNFRPALTSASLARERLERIAPLVSVLVPSFPAEARALLAAATPGEAAKECLRLGASAVAVTCGDEGVLLASDAGTVQIGASRVTQVVDDTGAGDVFAGTLAAHLAQGVSIEAAAVAAVEASARSLGCLGGTGWLLPQPRSTDECTVGT